MKATYTPCVYTSKNGNVTLYTVAKYEKKQIIFI